MSAENPFDRMFDDFGFEPCPFVEREATISMTFDHCPEHNSSRPKSGAVSSGGVNPEDLVKLILGVVEETLTNLIADFPAFRKLVATEVDGEVLPERAQKHIVKLMAHHFMTKLVVNREYTVPDAGAMLMLPVDD